MSLSPHGKNWLKRNINSNNLCSEPSPTLGVGVLTHPSPEFTPIEFGMVLERYSAKNPANAQGPPWNNHSSSPGEADPGNNSRRSRRTNLYQTASQSHIHHHPHHHLHHIIVTIHSTIIFIIVVTIIIPRTITTTGIFLPSNEMGNYPPALSHQSGAKYWDEMGGALSPLSPPCPSHPPTREAMCVGTPGGEV